MAVSLDLFSNYLCFSGDCIQFPDFNYWLYINDSQIYIFSPRLSPELETHILLPSRYLHRLGGLNSIHLFSHSSGV